MQFLQQYLSAAALAYRSRLFPVDSLDPLSRFCIPHVTGFRGVFRDMVQHQGKLLGNSLETDRQLPSLLSLFLKSPPAFPNCFP